MSEISLLRSSLSPIQTLLDTLRLRRADAVVVDDPTAPAHTHAHPDGAHPPPLPPGMLSARAEVYLQDVEDHVVLLAGNLAEMRRGADDLINMIFNTVAAYQNEAMRNLTLVTIFFLPLTFLTGCKSSPLPSVRPQAWKEKPRRASPFDATAVLTRTLQISE